MGENYLGTRAMARRGETVAVPAQPHLLPAPRSKGCAFCEQPADLQWVGGDELDEVVVYCCAGHVREGRERWEGLYVRFNAELES
jgi:hypothetical protein